MTDRELTRLAAKFKHEFTDYDKVVSFFDLFPEEHIARLHVLCYLKATGVISSDEFFKAQSKEIIKKVDLGRNKSAQKAFLALIVKRTMAEEPYYNMKQARQKAKELMGKHIHNQNKQNNRRVRN